MARPVKKGLDYFPFDVDLFQDIRIRKLIRSQGGKAITVYALLLCIIYKDGYYVRWDEELPFIISEQTGFEEAYIREVINCCLRLGLFSNALYRSDKVLTSRGIQDRYRNVCGSCRRNGVISEFNLLSSEEPRVSSTETAINSSQNPQNQGKARKENIRKSEENFPMSDIMERPLQECLDLMSANTPWLETICMNTRSSGHPGFTMELLRTYLTLFIQKLQNEGTLSKSPRDAMAHFARWLHIELARQSTTSSTSDQKKITEARKQAEARKQEEIEHLRQIPEQIEARRFRPPKGYTALSWYQELRRRAAAGDPEAIKSLTENQ